MKKKTTQPTEPTPAPTPYRKPVTCERTLRYSFSDAEKQELGLNLGEALQRAEQLEADLARVKTDFKARQSAIDAEISSTRDKVTSGYEMRLTRCEWHFDTPATGFKMLIRTDTAQEIETAAMSESERQIDLPLTSEDPSLDDRDDDREGGES